jgi:hypothetical protein
VDERQRYEQQIKEHEDELVKIMTAAGISEKEARVEAKRQVDSMGSTKTMRGECPLGATNPMSCMFCTRGHMTECHYPLTCELARCSHYLAELAAEGANDFPDSWGDLQHDIQMSAPAPKKARNHPTRGAQVLASILHPFHIMVRQCGWCNKLLGFKLHGTGVTTGLCKSCHKKEVESDHGGPSREGRPG